MTSTKVCLTVEAGAADLHRTVHDPGGWDRAVEVQRARQMWSLARPKEA